MITLYTTGCPRCAVLEKKLDGLGFGYEKESSVAKMQELGIMSAPMLCVDEQMFNFIEAVDWINRIEAGAMKKDQTEEQA